MRDAGDREIIPADDEETKCCGVNVGGGVIDFRVGSVDPVWWRLSWRDGSVEWRTKPDGGGALMLSSPSSTTDRPPRRLLLGEIRSFKRIEAPGEA